MAIFLPQFIEDMQADDEDEGSLFANGGAPGQAGDTCTLCGHGEYIDDCQGAYASAAIQCNACGHCPL